MVSWRSSARRSRLRTARFAPAVRHCKLFGGTYGRVDFQIPGDPNMVRMPATALMPVNRGVQVAVVGDGNKVVLKSIQLGRDFGDTVEVAAGLDHADRGVD